MAIRNDYPKFDYDSDEFYNRVAQLAMQGNTDEEIAINLGDTPEKSLRPEVFCRMTKGKYAGWTEEENERRSVRLCQVLTHARHRINSIVRGAYLKCALGGKRLKTRSTVTRRLRIDGQLTDDEEVQTTETESELAPNIQALATWLYHHDPDWRKTQRGEENKTGDVPTDIEHGIDVEAWIEKETTEFAGNSEDKPQ